MTVALGIDTGGTYTDAVLVDHEQGTVLCSAKALTTHHELSIGIARAVSELLAGPAYSPQEIGMVGLSTTLATNAIVEGQGSPVCLILIGYDPSLIEQYGFTGDLVTEDIVYIGGGHDSEGTPVSPLDEQALRSAVLARRGRVGAFAVSGYFGVRNPTHEIRARDVIASLTAGWGERNDRSLPVTCGHELTTRLNSVRRATTAALNARLIPLLQDLVDTVRNTLDELGVVAPLMIVKGDGSLVRASWAMRRPIETVLSGPAASVVGTWHLSRREDVWVIDVGGTTTDIAILRGGRPRLNPEGAQVGQWRTMVEAVDVHTVGLGGDSHVRLNGNTMPESYGITIGPRRVVPLSLLASQHLGIVSELEQQFQNRERMRMTGQFAVLHRPPTTELAESDRQLLDALRDGPRSLVWMADNIAHGPLVVRQLDGLIARQMVRRAAFTPTDALHVLGRFTEWDGTAARLGAELLAAQAGMDTVAFCEQVVEEMSSRVTTELVTKALADEASSPCWQQEPAATALLARAIGRLSGSDLLCQLSLRQPVVAVGAPVTAYLPRTTEQLDTELVIPAFAEVANAVGAVAGSVVQRVRALIRPVGPRPVYRLHLPDGIHDFDRLEEAVRHAQATLPQEVAEMARAAGAEQLEVHVERNDRTAPLDAEWGQDLYLETELVFSAIGRPGLVRGQGG